MVKQRRHANPALDRRHYGELFQLNEMELDLLTGLVPRQQVLLKRSDLAKVLTLTVDPKSYWIYTNTPIDNARVAETFREYGFEAGLDRLVGPPELWRCAMSRRVVGRIVVLALVGAPLSVVSLSAQTAGIREVSASARSVIPLQTRLRYTTMIVLPEDEEILDVICGDRDFWVISSTHNIAHVKPAKEGAATNLNLVTASGEVYSFLLSEKNGTSTPDLKVYVNADPTAPQGKPKYYSAAQMEGLQVELTEAKAAVEAAVRRAAESIATHQQHYPATLQFVYGTPRYAKPFLVRSMWHDGQFTYIKADATKLPALYEVKDGKPALLNFQVYQGTYVVPKVLDEGYFALGKERYGFSQQGR
jgi:type IV secretory pathway VirB9-like protein